MKASKHIAFKEKACHGYTDQYFRDPSGNWVKCNELVINGLWNIWIMNEDENCNRYTDEEGFIVYDYK
tara:strand:+ start:1754 stop:1957 length:204 start_codon:yes stop_codon:yes gene_type:complete